MLTDTDYCECADGGCPACHGHCMAKAVTVLYRVDMEDKTGTAMCSACADDAMESGLFTEESEDECDDESRAYGPSGAPKGWDHV